MCGLAGYLRRAHNQEPVQPDHLHALSGALAHRGPNGNNYWISDSGDIGFTHRRLSIVDLSDAGLQPMMDAEKTVVLLFNGAIYNHEALRVELEACGYKYRSRCDTETIVHAYKAWGIDCIKRFDGMFTLAIFDIVRDELYLVRDRMGIKPLYFSLQGNRVSFASEIKALWCLPWITKTINHTALSHYLTILASPAPLTLYEGIYKLPAACYAKVDRARDITFHHWYTPVTPVTAQEKIIFNDENLLVNHVNTLLAQSVKKRLMGDVPVGVFLSGGLDSSLITSMVASMHERINTFTVSFADEPAHSEAAWARHVSRIYNTRHHELVLTEKDAFDVFQKVIYHHDEPLGDCVALPLYYLAQQFRQQQVPIGLVGEGADELFGGYPLYGNYAKITPFFNATQRLLPQQLRALIAHVGGSLYRHKPLYADALYNWKQGNPLFAGSALAIAEQHKNDFLYTPAQEARVDPIIELIYPGMIVTGDVYTQLAYYKQHIPQASVSQHMLYLELKHRLPELILMRFDKIAMAHAIEGRVPFLDQYLVECMYKAPGFYRYYKGQRKYLLKKIAELWLPHEVIYRKKIGFFAPIQKWFINGTHFKPCLQDMLSSRSDIMVHVLKKEKINQMLIQHQKTGRYSAELWALQSLIASYTST